MTDLTECRKKIDAIDRKIAQLFKERMAVSGEVAEYKRKTGKPVYDQVREEEKLKEAESFADTEFNKKALRELFTNMMSLSRKYQYQRLVPPPSKTVLKSLPLSEKIGFYGGHGTYTELAMKDFFGEETIGISYYDFSDLCKAVMADELDYAVLPAENSTTGSISDIFELLREYGVHILSEKIERIDHALLGLPDAELSDITDIYTHAEPILQCDSFLKSEKGWRAHAYGSTAESAAKIKKDGIKSQAAIGSKRKASFYGLKVLADNIADDIKNATRFFLIGKEENYLEYADKISISFDIPHKSGSLYGLLSHFIHNSVNMTSIWSRPIPEKRWAYRFFVDLNGNLKEENVLIALSGICNESDSFTVLGNYPADRKK